MWKFIETVYNDISPLSAAVTVLVIFVAIVWYMVKDYDLPPGPIGFPFVGIYPLLKNDTFHLQLQSMGKSYGDVYSFNALGHLFVVLGSVKAVREALVTKADNFERYSESSLITNTFGGGLAFVNGEKWKVLRKYFSQIFKDSGMVSLKEHMADNIYDSLNSTIEDLHATKAQPVNISILLTEKSTNLLRRILFNDDGITKEEFSDFLEAYGVVIESMLGKRLILVGKFASRIMFPLIPGYKQVACSSKRMKEILYSIVDRHKSAFKDDQFRDVIDQYLKERNDRKEKGDPTAEYFTDEALVQTLIQVIGDGILSVAFFIGGFLQRLVEYPEEQEKIYKEIIEIVGPSRQARLEDKSKLPYTNAFIFEMMRATNIFPAFPSLKCINETTVEDNRIPKDAFLVVNFWGIHHKTEVYEDPDKFYPARFISTPEKQREELPIAFGIGKRSCPGESFTMTQVFLFLTNIIKNFELTLPEDVPASQSSELYMSGKLQLCAHPRANK